TPTHRPHFAYCEKEAPCIKSTYSFPFIECALQQFQSPNKFIHASTKFICAGVLNERLFD
ncbi:MAG: hypothetical protein Q8R57_00220, partial [Bacteroidota bacterium]|nr:hypothetical protein [Bacteroidota bacterium]